jgi:hypothetical protein
VLLRLEVPVHGIVSDSLATVFRGAGAGGRDVDELTAFVANTDRARTVAGRPPRSDLNYRSVSLRLGFGLCRDGAVLPLAVAAQVDLNV